MTQQATNRSDEASAEAASNTGSAPAPGGNRVNSFEQVIAAFTTAARAGSGARERPFDVAVRAYIGCYPGTSWEVAARIVADIISHRS